MACHAWAYSIGMQAFEDLGYHFLSSKCTIHHPPSPTDSSTVQRSAAQQRDFERGKNSYGVGSNG